MKTTRCFVALTISDEAVRHVVKLINQLQEAHANIKWVEPENLHITLNFLGDLQPNETVDVCRAVTRAVNPVNNFDFELTELGAFPNLQSPRTLWIGVGQGNEQLSQLQQAITEQLIELGYPPDSRKKFHPHLTLGRVKRESTELEELKKLIQNEINFSAGIIPALEVAVFASHLDRTGPKYTTIGRTTLQ